MTAAFETEMSPTMKSATASLNVTVTGIGDAPVALGAEMSPATNPVTASLNVTVTGIGETFVAGVVPEVIATVGGTVSTTTAGESALEGPTLETLSVAFTR